MKSRFLCFLIHAALHERAALQKMDGRVFLLSLRLALSLKLSHARILSLGRCTCRRGQRACKQANCDNRDCGFHGILPEVALLLIEILFWKKTVSPPDPNMNPLHELGLNNLTN